MVALTEQQMGSDEVIAWAYSVRQRDELGLDTDPGDLPKALGILATNAGLNQGEGKKVEKRGSYAYVPRGFSHKLGGSAVVSSRR